MTVQIAVAQIDCIVGDIGENAQKIIAVSRDAHDRGASVMITPELSVSGYPPEDLLYCEGFLPACEVALMNIASSIPKGLKVLVGVPRQEGDSLFNCLCLVDDGEVKATYRKQDLPNYGVFDEKRYFASGEKPLVFEVDGVQIGVLICEDLRVPEDAAAQSVRAGAEILIVANASPFYVGKFKVRTDTVAAVAVANKCPVIYCQMVGGQDEHVFDGASFAVNQNGKITARLPAFEETTGVWEINSRVDNQILGEISDYPSEIESLRSALVLGLQDYVCKIAGSGALIGLSGGIDSAVTLKIAVEALGADCVRAAFMPSRYTSDASIADVNTLAGNLGIELTTLSIEPLFSTALKSLEGISDEGFSDQQGSVEENLQARIRCMLLMALSNKWGGIVLTTGNKSEMACGYATLYGDMAGGFSVLKDVSKRRVYGLAELFNNKEEIIPRRILEREPTAELRHDQKDQDSLPPYDIIDSVVENYLEGRGNQDDALDLSQELEGVDTVLEMILKSEHKRKQATLGVTVTSRAFGKDWRMPICNRWQHRMQRQR